VILRMRRWWGTRRDLCGPLGLQDAPTTKGNPSSRKVCGVFPLRIGDGHLMVRLDRTDIDMGGEHDVRW